MIIISDASPLNYLVLIDAQNVLPRLYGRVLIPSEVWDELQAAPPKVRQWLDPAPKWLEIHSAPPHILPASLHAGEAAAVALAKEFHASLLLIDDDDAYHCAAHEGLLVTRTVGVLRDAAGKGFLNLAVAFENLKQTNFRVPHKLLDEILRDFVQAIESKSIRHEQPKQGGDLDFGRRTP